MKIEKVKTFTKNKDIKTTSRCCDPHGGPEIGWCDQQRPV